jgi:hypothetical protein
MSPLLHALRLDNSAWPIFLLSIPQLTRLRQRIGPRPGASGQVLSLLDVAQLLAVVHAAV